MRKEKKLLSLLPPLPGRARGEARLTCLERDTREERVPPLLERDRNARG